MARLLHFSAAGFAAALLLVSVNCGDSGSGAGGSTGSGTGTSGNCEAPCELVSQCGCGDTQACSIDSKGSHHCVTPGTGKPGDDCATIGCEPGSVCVAISSSPALSVCAKFCDMDADCTGGATCDRHLSDGMGATLPGIALCSDACDPAGNTGCPAAGTACVINKSGAELFTQCTVPKGTAAEGEDCSMTECAPGFLCGQSAAGSTCHTLCTPSGPHGCPGALVCKKLATPLVIGGVEYGACQ